MTARLPVTVSSVQTWFYMYAYVKKSSPGSTQLPTSRHLLSPHIVTSMTHTHTHTPINRLWSPLAYGLGGNKVTLPTSVEPKCSKFLSSTCKLYFFWLVYDCNMVKFAGQTTEKDIGSTRLGRRGSLEPGPA